MELLFGLLHVYAQVGSPDPLSVTDLAAALRRSERPLEGRSGQLRYFSRTDDAAGSTQPVARVYDFHFHASGRRVMRHNPEPDAAYSHDLWCGNAQYRFTLGKRNGKWILLGISTVNGANNQKHERFRAFREHFTYSHSFARLPLADVLSDASYEKKLTPLPGGLYRVDAERLDQNADGLSRVSATLAIGPEKRYAYITHAQGVVRRAGERTSLTVENTVKETPEGPELVESKETVKPLDGTSRGETEYVRTYEIHPIPSGADEASFYLSHYGFPEPDISAASSAPPMNRFIVFFVLLLCGVGLIVVGRNVGRRSLPA